jgi:hypothetical protein
MIGPILQSLIGTTYDVYPGRATQTAKTPFVVYSILSVDPSDTKQAGSGLDQYRVQLNVYSEQLTECETIATAIRATIDNYAGTIGTTVIDKIRFITEVDFFDDQAQYYSKVTDYKIRIKR